MKKAEVRTSIKDAILNRYSKDKTQAARPKDIDPIIKAKFGFKASEIATERNTYKSVDSEKPNQYVVVADGTVLKWETALKKALL